MSKTGCWTWSHIVGHSIITLIRFIWVQFEKLFLSLNFHQYRGLQLIAILTEVDLSSKFRSNDFWVIEAHAHVTVGTLNELVNSLVFSQISIVFIVKSFTRKLRINYFENFVVEIWLGGVGHRRC